MRTQKFVVFVDVVKYRKRGVNSYIVTKRFEIEAVSLSSACDRAVNMTNGKVSMVWPVY